MATLELGIDEEVALSPATRSRRLGWLFWGAIAWTIFIVAAAALASLLPLPSPTDMDMLERRVPISASHWLGTDGLGRDELARLIYGARVSLTVGLCAPVIGITIGGALGILAGYFRGRFESLVVGSMDVLLAFPPLILALAVTAYLGQSLLNLTCILGVLGIPAFMRVARAATLSLARREFVIAAQALGADLVLVGRAYLYGLMAGGERGVERAAQILTSEVRRTMQLLGVRKITELGPQHVTLP